MDGIAGVQARIQQIESKFGIRAAGGVLGTSDASTTGDAAATGGDPTLGSGAFASALAQAQGTPASNVAQAIANSPWGTHGGVLRVLASQRQ